MPPSILVVFLVFMICTSCSTGQQQPIVNTDKGPIQGFIDVVTGATAFLGVPYAQPPIGNLRWRVPQPHDPWTATRDATKEPNSCMQKYTSGMTFPSNVTFSEDCLYLNIWTSNLTTSSRAVMVWIHGGGLSTGGNCEYRLQGGHMAMIGNVVVVVMNYRLGAFGWLAHSAFSKDDPDRPTTGNYGLLDQRSALVWVKTNIHLFGGNPASVTIMGESAGGSSVSYHMAAPLSKGLYAQAIIESGASFAEMIPLQPAHQIATQFQQLLGCSGDVQQILLCMRSCTAQEVLDAQNKLSFTSTAVVDFYEFTMHIYQTIKLSQLNVVPLIAGNVLDEGTIFVSSPPISYTNYVKFLEIRFASFAPLVQEQYPCQSTSEDCWEPLMTLVGDFQLICPNILIANSISTVNTNTYGYVFTHAPLWGNQSLPGKGAFHSSEIAFVFSTLADIYPFTPQELLLARQMTHYWTNFAKTTSPNGLSSFVWPPYANNNSTDLRITLDDSYTVWTNYKKEECAFWSTIYDMFYLY